MKWLSLILALLAAPVWAVEPDEVLADPVLEERARALSQGLRCPVCQNESIDESDAEVARDLRVLVRERLVAGDTDDQVIEYVVDRYGEFVLLRPTVGGANAILWAVGPLVFLLVLAGLGLTMRRRSAVEAVPLSAEEEAKLARLLDDGSKGS